MKSKKEIENDPIIAEVRRAGDEMARESGYDLHALCARLRKAERKQPARYEMAKRLNKSLKV